MDPLGFALENFDAVGAWRTRDNGSPIDASGQFLDGTTLDGVAGLRQALVQRPDMFVGTLTEKLLTYALGRGLELLRHAGGPRDRPRRRPRTTTGFRRSCWVSCNSTPFQMRLKLFNRTWSRG